MYYICGLWFKGYCSFQFEVFSYVFELLLKIWSEF